MFTTDSYAYTSPLRKIDPVEKGAMTVFSLLVALVGPAPLTPLLVAIFWGALTVFWARISGRAYLKLYLLPLGFLVLGWFSLALSFSPLTGSTAGYEVGWLPAKTVWPSLGPLGGTLSIGPWQLYFTPAGLRTAGAMTARSLGALSCLYFFALTTPLTQMVGLLQALRVPSLISELMLLIYRFTFVLLDVATAIYLAQSARNGYARIKNGYFSLGQLVANLFLKAMAKGRGVFIALEARGYQGELRVLPERLEWRPVRLWVLLAADVFLLAVGWYFNQGV